MNHLDATVKEVLGDPPFPPRSAERQRWRKLARLLVASVDNVAPSDRLPLQQLVETLERADDFQAKADEGGNVAQSADGTPKGCPMLAAAQRERAAAAQLMHALRITPKARFHGNAKFGGAPKQNARHYTPPNTEAPQAPTPSEVKRARLRLLRQEREERDARIAETAKKA